MKPTDRMLLQLLSAAINAQNPTLDRALSDSEWNLVYGQAAKQGVLAVMWESVRRLPQDLQLVRSLKLQWAYGQRGRCRKQPVSRLSAPMPDAG